MTAVDAINVELQRIHDKLDKLVILGDLGNALLQQRQWLQQQLVNISMSEVKKP